MVLINETKKIIPKNELRKLKDKLIDSNTIKNPTNNKYDILLLIVFGIIISIVNYLIFNKMYYFNENEPDLKQYLKRRLNTLNTCGGFSMNETQFVENEKRAIKIILQEDFEAFKSEILFSSGSINNTSLYS